MNRMFACDGLTVTGTKEQIKKYNSDSREYDLVKDSIERLSEYMEQHEPKEPHVFIHQIRLEKGMHLVMLGEVNHKGETGKMIIPCHTKHGIMDSIPVDELNLLKDEEMKDLFMDKILDDASGLFSKEQISRMMEKYNEYKRKNTADIPELDESLVKTDTEDSLNDGFEL